LLGFAVRALRTLGWNEAMGYWVVRKRRNFSLILGIIGLSIVFAFFIAIVAIVHYYEGF